MPLLFKILLTMFIGGAILSILWILIFDKGDKYSSPLYEKKWQEYICDVLCMITILPVFIFLIIVIYGAFDLICFEL